MNPKVDAFLRHAEKWHDEMVRLRGIVLACGLREEFKWGQPCYTDQGRNIVLIHGFKEYCALLFFKGALMKDPNGLLIQQTENVQVPRQIRFTGTHEMAQMEPILKAYIENAMDVEKSGEQVKLKSVEDYAVPIEFQRKMDENPDVKVAFEALTPGRRKAWLIQFAQPKQAKTREARIEKALPAIFAGKGPLG
jgi:uncharacterized protein YdeI (YjbR/CyaY-like superfamily)